ncbi:MAG: STAS domain-containing protein [bacterium]
MSFITREELDGKVVVIEVPRRLYMDSSDNFRTLLSELVEQGKFQLVIDLSKTKFIDSTGLSAMLSRIATTRSNQGDIRLAAPSSFVQELLELTQFNQIIKCFKDVHSAVESFK